jgi:hypothetical protein
MRPAVKGDRTGGMRDDARRPTIQPPEGHDTDPDRGRPSLQIAAVVLWAIVVGATFAIPELIPLADPGDFLVRTTARLAVLGWAVAVALLLRRNPATRLGWTFACAGYLVHVASAFQYAHHWSHTAAYRHVEAVCGFGPGIFVSYAFSLLWTADVLWWWIAPQAYKCRPRWVGWALHGFMAFIVVNATVVYEDGVTRWASLAMFVVLAAIWLRGHRSIRFSSGGQGVAPINLERNARPPA